MKSFKSAQNIDQTWQLICQIHNPYTIRPMVMKFEHKQDYEIIYSLRPIEFVAREAGLWGGHGFPTTNSMGRREYMPASQLILFRPYAYLKSYIVPPS